MSIDEPKTRSQFLNGWAKDGPRVLAALDEMPPHTRLMVVRSLVSVFEGELRDYIADMQARLEGR